MERIRELGTTLSELVTAIIILSSKLFSTLKIREKYFFETSVPLRAAQRNVQVDGILHSHFRENLKSQ
jgi:hypothetical protein